MIALNRRFLRTLLCGVVVTAGLAAPVFGQVQTNKLVAEGRSFLANGQVREALFSFRQAAHAGSAEGACAAGELLLKQAEQTRGRDRLLQTAEGMGLLYSAATNHHASACAALSSAYAHGMGTRTNLLAAYSWLILAAEFDHSLRPNLDALVVQLEPEEIQQAQAGATEYRQGHWPPCPARPVVQDDPRLRVQGVSVGARGKLVVVNGSTYAVGDTYDLRAIEGTGKRAGERLTATCLEIGEDYMLVAVDGEPSLVLLSITHLAQN